MSTTPNSVWGQFAGWTLDEFFSYACQTDGGITVRDMHMFRKTFGPRPREVSDSASRSNRQHLDNFDEGYEADNERSNSKKKKTRRKKDKSKVGQVTEHCRETLKHNEWRRENRHSSSPSTQSDDICGTSLSSSSDEAMECISS